MLQCLDLLPWIDLSFDKEVSVLVSDLSGFTRLTREHGVVHCTSIIIRQQQIAYPILHKHGSVYNATQGDNVIAVFPSATAGALAARDMQAALAAYNRSLPQERDMFKVTISGIGLDYGAGAFVDTEGSVRGRPLAVAYDIGENRCEGGAVLMSARMAEEVRQYLGGGVLQETDIFSHVGDCRLFELTRGDVSAAELEVAPVGDFRFLHPVTLPLAQRHDCPLSAEDLQTLDDDIRQRHTLHAAALMFRFDQEYHASADLTSLQYYRGMDAIRPILQRHGGRELGIQLFVFNNACDAVRGVLEARQQVKELNAKEDVARRIVLTGFGIHAGIILSEAKANVHFGDPMNTASKLGQDIAENGALVISGKVYEELHAPGSSLLLQGEAISFEKAEITVSQTKMDCYFVHTASASRRISEPGVLTREGGVLASEDGGVRAGEAGVLDRLCAALAAEVCAGVCCPHSS